MLRLGASLPPELPHVSTASAFHPVHPDSGFLPAARRAGPGFSRRWWSRWRRAWRHGRPPPGRRTACACRCAIAFRSAGHVQRRPAGAARNLADPRRAGPGLDGDARRAAGLRGNAADAAPAGFRRHPTGFTATPEEIRRRRAQPRRCAEAGLADDGSDGDEAGCTADAGLHGAPGRRSCAADYRFFLVLRHAAAENFEPFALRYRRVNAAIFGLRRSSFDTSGRAVYTL